MQPKSKKNMELAKKLKNFDQVWQRVSENEAQAAGQKPKEKQPASSASAPAKSAPTKTATPQQHRGTAKPNNVNRGQGRHGGR